MASVKSGTDGADTIRNEDVGVIILGLGGRDSIINVGRINYSGPNNYYPDSVSIDGGAGNDTIDNTQSIYWGRYVSIDGGAGNDLIMNAGAYATLRGGDGNDTIYNYNGGSNCIIDGGTGNDSISHGYPPNVSINAGDGNDTISISGTPYSITIEGGTGDDLINNSFNGSDILYKYNAGDGNDTISTFNADDTLQIGDGTGTYSTQKSDFDIIVTVDDGKITLSGAASLNEVNIAGKLGTTSGGGTDTQSGGGGDTQSGGGTDTTPTALFTTNKTAKASITGTDYDDEVFNYGKNATIRGGDGNDLLTTMRKTSNVRLYGDAGDDTLEAYNATNVTLNGGAGNDDIYASSSNVTINAGAGNDTIALDDSAAQIQYKSGEGNDLIDGFNDDATLKIGNGTTDTYSTVKSGDNLIVTVGKGKLTLLGAADLTTLNILGTEKNPLDILGTAGADKIANTLAGATIQALGGNDSIKNTAASVSITGGAGNDRIVNTAASVSIFGGTGNDLVSLGANANNNLITYGGGNDTIVGYTEDDTISITGAATAEVSGSNVILTTDSGKIIVKGAAEKIITYVDERGEHTYPNQGVIIDGKTAYLTDEFTEDSFSIADSLTVETVDASIITYDIALIGNKKANSILGGTGNDTLDGGTGNDTLTGGDGSDVFYYTAGDGNDTITDYDEEDKIVIDGKVTNFKTTAKGNAFIYVGDYKILVKGGADKKIRYVDSATNISPNDDGTAVTLLSNYRDDTFNVNDYPDYAGTIKTIDASAVEYDIAITGNKLANTILGGISNDTLIGGKGNDCLDGDGGSDVFVYNDGDGNDTIVGYTQGEDRILIAADSVSASVSGKNVVLTVGKGKIVVKDGVEQLITWVDADGKEHFYPDEVKFNDAGTAATILADYHKSSFKISDYGSYGNTVQLINGASVTHNVSITANSKANTIYGSANNDYLDGGAAKDILYGGEGNDTLRGGTGNDTLWGGDGADTFVYADGDGKDIVSDFDEGDMLQITGMFSGTYNASTKAVAIKVGSTAAAITLEEFNATSLNINGDTYRISGTKLMRNA